MVIPMNHPLAVLSPTFITYYSVYVMFEVFEVFEVFYIRLRSPWRYQTSRTLV
jgi:hypothetical protein